MGENDMYQVPSKLILSTDYDLFLIHILTDKDPEVYAKLNFLHYFEQFAFGDLS